MQRHVASWGEPAPNGSRDHPWQLTDKMVKKADMTPEEVARYEGYMNNPEMSPLRQQMEVDLRKADAEQLTSTRIAEEKAAAAKHAVQLAKRHRDPEPGSLPAVASGKAPGGVDSMGALQFMLQQEDVNKRLATLFTPAQLQGAIEAGKPKDPRQIAAAKMESEIQRLEALAKQRPLTYMEHEGLACAREVIADQWATNISHKELVGMAIGLAMAPGIVAAPLVAGTSIAASMGANYMGKKIALACGADQTTAENVGLVAGLVAGGAAGLVRAPIVTAVETVLAVGAERGTEAALLAAGCSHEAASDIAAVVGAWTPLMTGGRAGALAERAVGATGNALKTGAQKAADVVSRVEVTHQPNVSSCNGLGGVKVSLAPKVEVPTTAPSVAASASVTKPAASWAKPVEVAPKFEYTGSAARSAKASWTKYTTPVRVSEPVRYPGSRMGEVGRGWVYTPTAYRPVMRPTTQVTTSVPPSTVRPTVEATSAAPAAPKVAEATVSGAKVELVYEEAAYHTTRLRQGKSPAPVEGQISLDTSIPVKDTSSRRVAVAEKDKFVIFDEHTPGKYHGHVVSWNELRQEAKNALIKAGKVTPNGKVVK